MGLVHAYKKGEVPASQVSQAVKDAAKSMKKKSTKKFASTKHKGLPNKVRSENMNEDGHTDVASAERKLKLIMKDAMDTLNALRSLSNEDSLPSWWTDKITLAKDYVGKSRDYIMNPAESVNEGKLDRIASQLIKDLDKEFPIGKYNPKKVSDFNKLVKHLKSKMSKLSNVNIGHLATDYHNYRQGQTDKERRPAIKGLVKTLKKLGMKESVNERISVSDERHFGKKGIIIMIDDNGKKVSAIFKDKKNADKFNRNKPSDIKKLLQLAKKTKFPKAIDESINEESKTIKSIQNLADKNKYGTVSGTRMNGKTAKEIIAIYNHPKMKSFRGKMDKLKSHELMDLTIRLPKILGIKVESANENIKDVMKNAIHQVKTFDKPSNAKLMTIKVINKLKEKRNSSKSTSNKKQLQKMINKVESDYKKGKYLKESVNEVSGVDVAKRVLKNKQYEKGIDLQTANLIVTIDKAYDKNPKLQKKFRAIKLPKMKQLILKYYG